MSGENFSINFVKKNILHTLNWKKLFKST